MTINYKVFAAGDTLSANDLLTYIENQAVIQVDNEAELTTLNTTYPSVRVAFAQDTDKMYVNNDGVWEAVVSGTSPSLTNLTLTGNLTVQGSTTTIDSTTIAVKDKFIFEGATADAHETTLQVAEPTADRTITLPDATGTVALTSGLYALPSQTGNSGKYLKTDGTNETWSIDATSDLVTTAGDIVYGTAADTMARLGIGTANQVLRVNSGATAPEWATPSSGGMTLINTGGTTLTGASVTIGSIPQTYKNLQLIIRNYKPATNDKRLAIRLNGDSGANRYITQLTVSASAAFGATNGFIIHHGNSTNDQGLNTTNFYDYTNTTTWKTAFFTDIAVTSSTSVPSFVIGQFVYSQLDAITSITLLPEDSANFTSGTAFLYGVS
jgi:hypothetical protein